MDCKFDKHVFSDNPATSRPLKIFQKGMWSWSRGPTLNCWALNNAYSSKPLKLLTSNTTCGDIGFAASESVLYPAFLYPATSCPAFSCPVIWSVIFTSSIFSAPDTSRININWDKNVGGWNAFLSFYPDSYQGWRNLRKL